MESNDENNSFIMNTNTPHTPPKTNLIISNKFQNDNKVFLTPHLTTNKIKKKATLTTSKKTIFKKSIVMGEEMKDEDKREKERPRSTSSPSKMKSEGKNTTKRRFTNFFSPKKERFDRMSLKLEMNPSAPITKMKPLNLEEDTPCLSKNIDEMLCASSPQPLLRMKASLINSTMTRRMQLVRKQLRNVKKIKVFLILIF